MADNDQSIYTLRFNQLSNALEGFGGGSPQWTQLTLTNVDPTQVPVTRLISTTAPLQGGGNLSADRTLSLANSGVTPGSYTNTNLTVDAFGRITLASNGSSGGTPAGANTQIQYYDSGAFGASADFTWNDSTKILRIASGVGNVSLTAATTNILEIDSSAGTTGYGEIGADSDLYLFANDTGAAKPYIALFSVASPDVTPGAFIEAQADNGIHIIDATGPNNTAPDASAVVEIYSTARGFLPPRLSTAQRNAIASPANGLQIYNTTTLQDEFYNGTTWGAVGGGGSTPTASAQNLIATPGFSTTSGTYVATGHSLSYALSSASRKVKITVSGSPQVSGASQSGHVTIFADGTTDLAPTTDGLMTLDSPGAFALAPASFSFLYSPGDTASHSYEVYIKVDGGATFFWGGGGSVNIVAEDVL